MKKKLFTTLFLTMFLSCYLFTLGGFESSKVSSLALENIEALASGEGPFNEWQPCYYSCSSSSPGLSIEIRSCSGCTKVRATSWGSQNVCRI